MRCLVPQSRLWLLAVVGAASAANPDEHDLIVRVYNDAAAPWLEVRQAIDEVERIFNEAHVRLAIVPCPPGSGSGGSSNGPCAETSSSLSVRLIERVPKFVSAGALGFALVNAGAGNHCAVIYPRIVRAAEFKGDVLRPYTLLAHAMAHEIAHLITGSVHHKPSGLFRSQWTPSDLTAMGRRRLAFATAEVIELHQGLKSRLSGPEQLVAQRMGAN